MRSLANICHHYYQLLKSGHKKKLIIPLGSFLKHQRKKGMLWHYIQAHRSPIKCFPCFAHTQIQKRNLRHIKNTHSKKIERHIGTVTASVLRWQKSMFSANLSKAGEQDKSLLIYNIYYMLCLQLYCKKDSKASWYHIC